MGRTRAPALREELLDRATRHVLAHGLPDLSLRQLGQAIGTTARMLVYHFGSKEALVAAVVSRVLERQQKVLLLRPGSLGGADPVGALTQFWEHLTCPETRPLLRLLFEVDVLSLQNPVYAAFSREAFARWRTVVTALLTPTQGPARAEDTATLIVGTVTGLLLDLMVTDEFGRVDRAFRSFLAALVQGGQAS